MKDVEDKEWNNHNGEILKEALKICWIGGEKYE